jgi:beta-barrel assembly-enhancing protease
MSPPEEPSPPTQGFQMSSKRALGETALVLGVVLGVIFGVMWLAGRGAAYFTDSVPLSVDRTLGEQSARLLHMTTPQCADPAAQRYVEAIAAPLLAALDDRRFEYHFVVVDDAEVNAFALPGGFVTVNSGLLATAESGEEVAAVLAHELQHVVLRHGTRRMLRELGASTVLSAIFGGTDIAVPARATHDLVSTAYDRDEESEADARGLALLVRAGIDPRGMARFFARLAKESPQPPALLSTHPDPGDRAEAAAKAARAVKQPRALPSPRGLTCK